MVESIHAIVSSCFIAGVDVSLVEETRKAVLASERGPAQCTLVIEHVSVMIL